MQTSDNEQFETRHAMWTLGEIAVATIALATLISAGIYAVLHGVRTEDLCLTALMASVISLGAYDTRHNQPTLYNLLRSWPFGSAAEDQQRGKRTVSSQALHGLFCVSIALCLALVALKRP
jgi:hypothetical protein